MIYLWIGMLLTLVGCVSPVYEQTTFGIDDFAEDSRYIDAGKYAILEFENGEEDLPTSIVCSEERIIEGDELSITLYSPERPDRMQALELIDNRVGFRVCDGKICIPQLPTLLVAGKTLKEVKDEIQSVYDRQMKNIQVYVGFKQRRERTVGIIGTGVPFVSIDSRTRLSEVLARADLPPYANLFKSYLVRDEENLQVDFYKLIHEGDETQNVIVQGGDQIYIAKPDAASIMVTGEIGSRLIPVPYGFTSLSEALAMAGGIPFTGDKSHIYVIRGELKRPKIYEFSLEEALHRPVRSLLLMPGDIVYLAETPITQWNRFISQLQVSARCCFSGYGVYSIFSP